MNNKSTLLLVLLCLVTSSFIFAQNDTPGENLTIQVAVMGPGDEIYFWWGHIALVIEDSDIEQSFFYDYGLFSFEQVNFYYNFAMGRLWYSCGISLTERNLDVYKATNRDIKIYTLDLPVETRIKVRNFANVNVLPENRNYLYHHFDDNCSTRIRDIIDIATDGQFKELYANTPSRFTLRQQVRRHTWFSPVADWFVSYLMGQGIDLPITVWEDMFLPSEVGNRIEDFWYTDINGERRKLVSSVEILNTAKNRPAVLDVPRRQWPYEFIFSLLLSAVFCLFSFIQARKPRIGSILTGFSMSLSALFFGSFGLLLYFMSLFTEHDYTFHNANMLFCTPILLAAVPLGICYALTKSAEKQLKYDMLLRAIWLLSVIGVIVSMLIKLLPWFWQDNLTDQLLVLPIALAFTLRPFGLKEVANKYLPFLWRKK
jgi:hypothetical protein